MSNPHVVILPYPAQGHVLPLMELAQTLAQHGVQVTFINTEATQKRMGGGLSAFGDRIQMVTIPDGLEEDDNRDEHWKLYDSIDRTMPGELEALMQEMKNNITCLVADTTLGWALEIAEKIGVHRVGFHSAAAAVVALGYSIPKLIQDGIIDQDGTPLKVQKFELSENMPIINTTDLLWASTGNLEMQKLIFRDMIKNNTRVELAEWFICNSNYELESGAFNITPQLVPIGPLLASNRLGDSAGSFWPEDNSCLTWLDQQPDRSVIFVAFGSFTMFNKNQFEELALGLELTNRPFLWVVRPGTSNDENECYPDGFLESVAARAKMVSWAPQQKVLRHSSIACFMSHCGWNSTLEGVSSGVPFLCWPYFADQLMNESYICHVWKVGLGFKKDENGIVRRSEISDTVEQLLGNDGFTERALDLKEKITRSVMEGGSTHKNMSKFIQWIKEGKN